MNTFDFEARYYDAGGFRQRRVRVWVHNAETVIVQGSGIHTQCRVAELRISASVLGNTLHSLLLPGGAKCETLDRLAASRLRQLQRGQSPSALRHWIEPHRLEQSWLWAIAALAWVALLLSGAYFWGIPAIARSVARASPEAARKIGQGTLSLLDLTFEPSQLPEARKRTIVGDFQEFAGEYPDLPLRLEFRKVGLPNAFALPDGTIVLTDELVNLSTHDSQLSGVLLHEIGHVAHGHALRRVIESSALGVLAIVYYGEADHVTAVAGGLPLLYAKSRYSRADELEADTTALDGMRRHGLEPHHFADILRALEHELGSPKSELRYFSSHPATHERAERFDRAQSELDRTSPLDPR